MPSPIPTPVAAALGIVPTVLGGVRRLPGKAVQLPIFAVSSALTTLDTARREYDALAERGERLIARLRGSSLDELEDRVESVLSSTPLARPYDAVEDAVEDATESVTALVRNVPAAARKAPAQARKAASKATTSTGRALDRAADSVEDAAAAAARSASSTVDALAPDEAKKGAPTPKATEPDTTRIDTAASSDVVEAVERVSATVGGAVPEHDDLPLPDYDHMTLGSLRGRMRSLDLPELVQVRDYEKAHADRLPIVTMLDNRIAKLAADPTAPLSGGSPTAPEAAKPTPSAGGSPVSPATSAPAQSPPAHGDPTNPA